MSIEDYLYAVIEVQCIICNKSFVIKCRKEDYVKWKNKEGHIQDLLGYLTTDERELLISGTCGECFDKMFAPEEE